MQGSNNGTIDEFINVVQGRKKQCKKYEEECKIKICFLGSSGVGKTSLVRRFSDNIYNPHSYTTLGVAFTRKIINVDNKTFALEIWDTAGQERYEALVPMYYRGAGIIVIVFDVNDEKTFTRAQKWVIDVENTCFNKIKQTIILLGNKSDYEKEQYRQDQKEKYAQYANKNNIIYYECSAKTGFNVADAINHGVNTHITNFYEDIKNQTQKEGIIIDEYFEENKRIIKCCN